MGDEKVSNTDLLTFMKELKSDLNKRMDKLDDNAKKCYDDLTNLKTDVQLVTKNYDVVTGDINCLNKEVNIIKQRSLVCDVVITGIPDNLNENILNRVNIVLSKYDLQLKEPDYFQIYRLKNHTGYSPICIELRSKKVKDDIFSKQKSLGPVLLQMVDNTLAKSDIRKIYFKDKLTNKTRELFIKAREFKREFKYKYCWLNNSQYILLKESDASKVYRIEWFDDLQKLREKKCIHPEATPSTSKKKEPSEISASLSSSRDSIIRID